MLSGIFVAQIHAAKRKIVGNRHGRERYRRCCADTSGSKPDTIPYDCKGLGPSANLQSDHDTVSWSATGRIGAAIEKHIAALFAGGEVDFILGGGQPGLTMENIADD